MRIEDEHIHLRQAPERFDRRAACIARGRPDNGGALPAGFEHMIHQPTQQLHRHVFEGQCRAVKQFEHEQIVVELHQRAGRLMAEAGIGGIDHRGQIGCRDIAGIGADDRFGNLRIALARKTADGGVIELRPLFGPIQPAVTGQTRQNRIGKTKTGRLPAGRDIMHGSLSLIIHYRYVV